MGLTAVKPPCQLHKELCSCAYNVEISKNCPSFRHVFITSAFNAIRQLVNTYLDLLPLVGHRRIHTPCMTSVILTKLKRVGFR